MVTKPFRVYGRFTIRGQGVLEAWFGQGKTAAVALRRAVAELWKRPEVRWKHVTHAAFTVEPGSEGDHAHEQTATSQIRPRPRHRRH